MATSPARTTISDVCVVVGILVALIGVTSDAPGGLSFAWILVVGGGLLRFDPSHERREAPDSAEGKHWS
jgi:hypothetical protein